MFGIQRLDGRQLFTIVSLAIVAAVGGCGSNGGQGGPTEPSSFGSLPATMAFTQSPIATSTITRLIPLGNLNPPGHTIPTDHIYFYHSPTETPVTAPAGGAVIVAGKQNGIDDSVLVQATSGIRWYINHIRLDTVWPYGAVVTAGQRLGVTTTPVMDLGVSNAAITLSFVRPDRYSFDTLHADSPLKYFEEPLRSQFYGIVEREGPDKDGKIDFDQPGRLVGNWFLDGLPPAVSENLENTPKHLAFVRDAEKPDLRRISIGGSLSMVGAYYLADAAPDPADITPASGRVGFVLHSEGFLRTGNGVGVFIAQMLADDRIRTETIRGGTSLTADFTEAALIYTR